MKILSLVSLILTLFACTNNVDQATNKSSEVPSKNPVRISENQALFDLIKEKDSLLFQIGFNQIDTLQIASLISMDFEFYHDKHGVTDNKQSFLMSINGLRDLPFKTWRTLVDGSMEVFPLCNDNGKKPYGAIQNGIHDFYQQIDGEDAHKTSTAKFTHLWIVENGDWKLKRVLSYDHQAPKLKEGSED